VFILGGGANLVVADEGIRGIVLDTGGYAGVEAADPAAAGTGGGETLFFCSGTPVDEAVEYAAARGLSGLEFLAGMPGSVGGALWMNARCYEQSVSDVLVEAEVIDLDGGGAKAERRRVPRREEEFGYKTSPFQIMDALITGGVFALKSRPESEIRRIMEERRRDREAKGHYRYPSAGSVFKNSRALGKPTGAIIDDLGLRGLSVGDAQVAPWHGNIIINRGNASGSQIRELILTVQERVRAAAGIELECEVLFVGFPQDHPA
jgi:UDP-N-acetylmuramate dehydrogenase